MIKLSEECDGKISAFISNPFTHTNMFLEDKTNGNIGCTAKEIHSILREIPSDQEGGNNLGENNEHPETCFDLRAQTLKELKELILAAI